MGHVFLCRGRTRGDLSERGCYGQEVFHPMAHLASQQLVCFLGLLALGDIEEDAEHDPIGYVRIVALATGRNPTDVAPGQNSEVDLVGAYHCTRGSES